jgi:hypothetical protein
MRGYNAGEFDFFPLAADGARDRFQILLEPLPRDKPSVNLPYREASPVTFWGKT